MPSLRKRGRVWYYRVVDADGVQHERKGCSDKRETEAMAAAAESEASKVRAGLIDPKAVRYREYDARPLADHLAEFRAALLAKGGTENHARKTTHRVDRVLSLARVRRVSDLSLSEAQTALAALRSEGLAAESINHHVRAVKAFAQWLWRDGRAREHYLAHLGTVNSDADRRRRRALTTPEALALVNAAENGPAFRDLTGPDRAMLYRVALGTGFRAGELASLTPASFRLDRNPAAIVCEAAYTKNGKLAEQPIPDALADALPPWEASRPPGRSVFGRLARTGDMIKRDLAAAGVESVTASGWSTSTPCAVRTSARWFPRARRSRPARNWPATRPPA